MVNHRETERSSSIRKARMPPAPGNSSRPPPSTVIHTSSFQVESCRRMAMSGLIPKTASWMNSDCAPTSSNIARLMKPGGTYALPPISKPPEGKGKAALTPVHCRSGKGTTRGLPGAPATSSTVLKRPATPSIEHPPATCIEPALCAIGPTSELDASGRIGCTSMKTPPSVRFTIRERYGASPNIPDRETTATVMRFGVTRASLASDWKPTTDSAHCHEVCALAEVNTSAQTMAAHFIQRGITP